MRILLLPICLEIRSGSGKKQRKLRISMRVNGTCVWACRLRAWDLFKNGASIKSNIQHGLHNVTGSVLCREWETGGKNLNFVSHFGFQVGGGGGSGSRHEWNERRENAWTIAIFILPCTVWCLLSKFYANASLAVKLWMTFCVCDYCSCCFKFVCISYHIVVSVERRSKRRQQHFISKFLLWLSTSSSAFAYIPLSWYNV